MWKFGAIAGVVREGRPGGGKRGSPLGSLRSDDIKSHTSWADLGLLRKAAAHEVSVSKQKGRDDEKFGAILGHLRAERRDGQKHLKT